MVLSPRASHSLRNSTIATIFALGSRSSSPLRQVLMRSEEGPALPGAAVRAVEVLAPILRLSCRCRDVLTGISSVS